LTYISCCESPLREGFSLTFWADLPTEDLWEEDFDVPNEEILHVKEDLWMMYFNGASNQKGFRVGILLVLLKGAHIPISVKLDFKVTNNMEQYEA